MKEITHSFVTLVVLLSFGLLLTVHAVVPPPDGGYPNFTTAEGVNALFNLTSGAANTAVGWFSLNSVTTGSFNTGLGTGALALNTGDANTATGVAALLLNTTGENNTANGTAALVSNSTGEQNTAVGAFALNNNTTGSFNTATGFDALFSNTEGNFNTAYGHGTLDHNTVGIQNDAFGGSALQANTEGFDNTAVGESALSTNTTGNGNTAVGFSALGNCNGINNVALGNNSGGNVTTANNVICIGATVGGENVDNSCYIGNIFNVTSASGIGVLVSANGKLGTTTSSKRFKEQIRPMADGSEALYQLKPVAFRYKKEIDPGGVPQLGLVAEDVEKVNRDLVVHDKQGNPYSVRYDQVNAMLLNEFLKEHATVQELKKEIAALKAGLQEVTNQLKVSRSVPLAENRQ